MKPCGNESGQSPVCIPDLTAAISRGDEAAFARFHRLYWKRLFAYLMVLTKGNETLAEDLAQTTMVRAARRMRQTGSEPELWAWIARIARNAFIDTCRTRRNAPQFVELTERAAPARENPYPPERRLLAALDESLGRLSVDDRRLIEETYLDGRKQADTAASVGLSIKAVESRLTRLRGKLRKLMIDSLRDE